MKTLSSEVVVEFKIDRGSYDMLCATAHIHGKTVAELLQAETYRITHLMPEHARVALLHKDGCTDAQIAAATGWTNERVSKVRRTLGLPPHHREPTGRTPKVRRAA